MRIMCKGKGRLGSASGMTFAEVLVALVIIVLMLSALAGVAASTVRVLRKAEAEKEVSEQALEEYWGSTADSEEEKSGEEIILADSGNGVEVTCRLQTFESSNGDIIYDFSSGEEKE